MSTYQTDVAIIGAGPVGLFAVFECGMLKLKCHVIDTLSHIGGQCRALYPEKPIYDIPAYPKILAGTLIDKLEEQIQPFQPQYHMDQKVESLTWDEEAKSWHLKTSNQIHIIAKAVIIAAGVGAFGPNRPPLETIESYEGKSVFYYIKNKEQFRDKTLVIAGGGDSAIDWALNLVDIARRVIVVHRRAKFRGAPNSIDQLHHLAAENRLDILTPFQLAALEGENGQLQAVHLKSLEGTIKRVEAQCLLPFFGLSMNLGPIAEWGLHLDKHCIEINPQTCATSTVGIYAIGDIATYPHKLKLILTGFAEGAQAAHAIRAYLYPEQTFHFAYSTTTGLPGTP